MIRSTYARGKATDAVKLDSMPTPHGARLLVRPVQAAASDVIEVPSHAEPLPCEGEVLAVGNGNVDEKGRRTKCEASPGDRVLFKPGMNQDILVGPQEELVLLMPFEALIAQV